MSSVIKIKRGLEANLSSAGVVAGELKYTTDKQHLFVGDGTNNVLLNDAIVTVAALPTTGIKTDKFYYLSTADSTHAAGLYYYYNNAWCFVPKDVYNKTEADAKFAEKATTLEGYGIADAYTKTETDGLLDEKADADLVPSQASTSNQLADKAFVNSSIATNTANYISDDGEPFASLAALQAYTGTKTNNDYAFVKGTDEQGNTTYTRYKYVASSASWSEEYILNNSSFTATQWAAISSGITAAKVSTYDGYAALIAAKADADDVYTKDEVDDALADKQDSLSTAQLAAVDSGITASKVSTYDGYAAQIEAKVDIAQGTTNAGKILAVNASGNLELTDTIDGGTF